MEIVGKHVEHSVFGEGVVAAQEGKRITISFDCGDKKFSFPDVFRHFCTVNDEELRKEIQNALLLEDRSIEQVDAREQENIRNVQNFKAKYKIK